MKIPFLLLAFTSLSMANTPWGGEELSIASAETYETFLKKFGREAFLNIKKMSIELKSTKTSAKATVVYKSGSEDKTVEFLCHLHEGTEIDCH